MAEGRGSGPGNVAGHLLRAPMASTPAYPPPTTTKVSAVAVELRRPRRGGDVDALEDVVADGDGVRRSA